ncbi:hypothetical protein Tco_0459198 [Tanacetum coccineum]
MSHVRSGRRKGYMCSGDYEDNVLKMFKKDVVPRKTRSLTIAEETVAVELAKSFSIDEQRTQQRRRSQLTIDNDVADMYAEWGQKLKGSVVKDPANLFDETPINELIDLMSNPVYTYAHTTSTVHKPEGNPKKLKALAIINVSKAFEKAVQARVLTEIKKLLPTHIPTAIINYDRPCLNTSIKLLNRIHLNKSNDTHTTHQQLYDTLYESITLDQEALNAQDADPSFHKRSSRRKTSPVVHAQDDTPVMQPLDQEDEYIRTCPNPEWYTKSGSAGATKRRTTWFDLLLKSDIDQNKNHILGPSTVAIVKKLKAIIQHDELTIADLDGVGLEKLKQQYKNDVELEYHVDQLKPAVLSKAKWNSDEDDVSKSRSFERHMSKNTKSHPSFYNNDFYYLVSLSTKEKYTTSLTKHYAARYYIQGIEDMISNRWCKETHPYHFEALNGIHHWKDSRINFSKAEMIRRSDDKEYEFSYADLPRLSLNNVEDMYLLQVQDKLHHLLLEFVKDFNNSLLLFIRRVVIQNRVEDIQLGVESYKQTLNLTKPMMFFEGIDQKIPFTMSKTYKGALYLNQHNVKSFMKFSEVKKFYDGTLVKLHDNLIDMVNTNKLGKGNRRLKGKDWTDNDVVKSNEMVNKIDQTLKRKEQLRRLEEYVGRRPKIVTPRTFEKRKSRTMVQVLVAYNQSGVGELVNWRRLDFYSFIVIFAKVMATLSEVSEYLNNLETLIDDGDSSEIRMGKFEKNEEELEMFEVLIQIFA